MIGRVRDRATFEALRRHGQRVRRGPVTVVYLADDVAPPRAAFAVGRNVGSAVSRNRVRRRLRSVLRDLDRGALSGSGGLAPGTYLLTARPEAARLPYRELTELVSSACAALESAGEARS